MIGPLQKSRINKFNKRYANDQPNYKPTIQMTDQQVQGKSSFLLHKLTVPYLVKKFPSSHITEPKG